MSPPLSPTHVLAYLRELQPGAGEVVLLGSGGVLLAGEEGLPAQAARELQRAGGRRSLEGCVLALAVGEHAIAALVPDGCGALVEHDLGCAASAVDVRFVG